MKKLRQNYSKIEYILNIKWCYNMPTTFSWSSAPDCHSNSLVNLSLDHNVLMRSKGSAFGLKANNCLDDDGPIQTIEGQIKFYYEVTETFWIITE